MAELPTGLLCDETVTHRAARAAAVMWSVVRRDDPDPIYWETHTALGERMGTTKWVAEKAVRDLCRAGWVERIEDPETGKWVTRLVRTPCRSVDTPPAVTSDPPQTLRPAPPAATSDPPCRNGTPPPCRSVQPPPAVASDPPLPLRPSTSPKPSPKPSPEPPRPGGPASSGLVFELDVYRRELSVELGVDLPPWGGKPGDVPDGIGRALAEENGDLEAVRRVLRATALDVKADRVAPVLFRRIWVGDGYGARKAAMQAQQKPRGGGESSQDYFARVMGGDYDPGADW